MLQTTRKVNCTSLWNVQFLGQTWNLSQMTQIAWVKSTWVKISGHGQIFQELTWKMTVSIKIVVFRLNVSQNNWSDFVFEKKFEKSTKVTCVGLSQVQTQILRISTKHQIQNLDQTSASRLNLKFKILTKTSFRISTKIQLHNFYKTSAAKYWPNSSFRSCLNFNFKISTKPWAQRVNKSLALWPNLSFQIKSTKQQLGS